MNERHESGFAPDYDAYGYDPYSTGSYQTVGAAFTAVGTAYGDDTATGLPYGSVPPQQPSPQYGQGHQEHQAYEGQQVPQDYGYAPQQSYDPSAGQSWETGTYAAYDPYAYGQYAAPAAAGPVTSEDTGTYTGLGYLSGYGDAAGVPQAHDGAAADQTAMFAQQDWDSGAYPAYGATGYATGYGYDASGDTGVYEYVAPPGYETSYETGYGTASQNPAAQQPASHAANGYADPNALHDLPDFDALHDPHAFDPPHGFEHGHGLDAPALDDFDGLDDGHDPQDPQDPHGLRVPHDPRDLADLGAAASLAEEDIRHDYAPDGFAVTAGPTARSRRRKPAKRSALLSVAVPSVAVMGVAAVGAAAVTGVGMAQDAPDSSTTQAGAETGTAPTTQLDRQLAGVSRDADDFASRASRSQERLDLRERQAAAKQAAAAAAARKEALRPKFVLPVKQKGLSAYFGQAGVNWMALHTGIDFPVQPGTPVMAVTDGTVRTQWNVSYGNMAIVTAPDGTETWYCHLSSTKIRSGKVKAGTVIAYSGNTGNTTGPHLHLEVRPHSGSPIDPLQWLLDHGLDPR